MNHIAWYRIVGFVFIAFLFCQTTYAQWVSAGSVANIGPYPSVSVVDANTAWIAGGPSGTPVIYRTTNGGTNWTPTGTSGLSLEMFCVWAIDSSNAFVGNGGAPGGAGGNAQFYKTTNGGSSWTLIDATGGSAGFFNGIVFSKTRPSFGVAQSDPPNGAGQPYYLNITTDGGATWNRTNPPGVSGAASAQNSVVVVDDSVFGFGLNAGASRVYLTSDGGATWNVRSLGVTGSFVSGFAMSDNRMNGIAATNTSLPNIARTTDGGATWSTVNIGTGVTSYCTMKWIPGTSFCYLSGSSGGFKKSTDGGSTWTTMTPTITGVWHMEFAKGGNVVYGYAITTSGAVYKLTDVLTAVASEGPIPENFTLSQNYPNPFNPTTTITYRIGSQVPVSLRIYNVLGELVKVLVSEAQNAGTYSVNWDGTADDHRVLSSGVYTYQLVAGEYRETRKMMFLK